MQSEFDLLGAFVPTIAAWFVLSLAIFVAVDALLTRGGFYRLFWHVPLARFALFACLFSGGARRCWFAQLRSGELLSLFAMDTRRPRPRQCGHSRTGRFRLRR